MRRLSVCFILTLILLGVGVEAYAQISNAAVLFLRIAPGARAASLGEAYVAISDDATATHWNPAGLGQYPLNSKWFDISIPDEFRPIKSMALYKGYGATGDIDKYDVWAISNGELVRFSKNVWAKGESIPARGSQTLEALVREYTGIIGISGEEKVLALIEKIAKLNNKFPLSDLEELRDNVMAGIEEDYNAKSDLDSAFSNLINAYNKLNIDWQKIDEAKELYSKFMKDSSISEIESDRLLFLVEKANWPYLPSAVEIPFEINFSGAINDIASDDKYLWIATDSGLFRYEDGAWRRFGINEGLASESISRIEINKEYVSLFSDSGLIVYHKGAFVWHNSNVGLPENGQVSAVYYEDQESAWAVVDNDLYRYDGKEWRNYILFNDTAQSSADDFYETMKLYETDDEREKFLVKFNDLNGKDKEPEPITEIITKQNISGFVDSIGAVATVSEIDRQNQELQQGMPSLADRPAGTKVPFTAGFNFTVTDIAIDEYNTVWVGTNFGILNFNGRKWRWLGYRNYVAENETSVYDIALKKVNGDAGRAERLSEIIRTVNNLDSDAIEAGQVIRIYSNPAGSKINDIHVMGSRVYFATTSGGLYFDGVWNRITEKNLGRKSVSKIMERDGSMYVITKDGIAIRAAAKSELTMMHVNWLPDLTDDIYYEYLGYVQNVEGWGTVGANVTFLSYGEIIRTNTSGVTEGQFSAFDIAFTLSYGSSLTDKLSGGISAKIIYSHLSDLGAGRELGSGTSTGLAIDLGLLYRINSRLSLGAAIVNLGPEISYIDVSQSDPLPRNLAVGVAWKMVKSSYNELLFTFDVNKSLAERDRSILEDFRDILASPVTGLKSLIANPLSIGGISKDFDNAIINAGIEYKYGSFFAIRGGYIYDEVGDVKTPTFGAGLASSGFKFDFAYIFSNDEVPLANTMRFSLTAGW